MKSISSQDGSWLDHDANLVDEQQALEVLEDASDYERGFDRRLDEAQKGAVRSLREAAGDLGKVVGSKREKPECMNREPNKKKDSPSPVFTKKENATLAQRIEILDWYHANGGNQFRQHPSSTGMLNISTIPLHASLKQFWPLSDVKYIWRNPGQCPPPVSLIILLVYDSHHLKNIPNARGRTLQKFSEF
ncbi:hypothetical protein AZE42_03647 [Rhizopogon vesiculosus]|uniref:Uncharacterized protein n=1 Tax=Rhizopogon vesiculosus TaxID=180088 RepID=A0A1J8QUJ8_9AGAM|nr:hypothetical protein AZE42_03647 [Rhizopogon vesiculosus]